MSQDSQDDLSPWRDQIDALDKQILALLNQRAEAAQRIGHIKQRLNNHLKSDLFNSAMRKHRIWFDWWLD